MRVDIYSRKAIEKLLQNDFPKNVAVISFYDPVNQRTGKRNKPVDYSLKTSRVFPIAIHDIDLEVLLNTGLHMTLISLKLIIWQNLFTVPTMRE